MIYLSNIKENWLKSMFKGNKIYNYNNNKFRVMKNYK